MRTTFLSENLNGRDLLGAGSIWEDDIKQDVMDIVCEDVDWSQVDQDGFL
jgi:hypothetical protein